MLSSTWRRDASRLLLGAGWINMMSSMNTWMTADGTLVVAANAVAVAVAVAVVVAAGVAAVATGAAMTVMTTIDVAVRQAAFAVL